MKADTSKRMPKSTIANRRNTFILRCEFNLWEVSAEWSTFVQQSRRSNGTAVMAESEQAVWQHVRCQLASIFILLWIQPRTRGINIKFLVHERTCLKFHIIHQPVL